MAFTFYYNTMPAGVGAAMVAAQDRKASFARKVELARLQLARQGLELEQTKQLQVVEDWQWRKKVADELKAQESARLEQQRVQEQAKLGQQRVKDQFGMNLDLLKAQREQEAQRDVLSGGPEKRRLQAELELAQGKTQIAAPERAATRLRQMVEAGWVVPTPGSPGVGGKGTQGTGAGRPTLTVDGLTMEFQGKGKYGAWETKQIGNLDAQIRTVQMGRDAKQKQLDLIGTEQQKLRTPKGELLPVSRPAYEKLEKQKQALGDTQSDEARITQLEEEKQRLIDKLLPPDEAERRQQQTGLELAANLERSGKLDAGQERLRALALAALQSDDPVGRSKGAAVLLKLKQMVGH